MYPIEKDETKENAALGIAALALLLGLRGNSQQQVIISGGSAGSANPIISVHRDLTKPPVFSAPNPLLSELPDFLGSTLAADRSFWVQFEVTLEIPAGEGLFIVTWGTPYLNVPTVLVQDRSQAVTGIEMLRPQTSIPSVFGFQVFNGDVTGPGIYTLEVITIPAPPENFD